MMKTSRQGWTGLQRQQGTEFVKWLRKEKRLQAGFRVLAALKQPHIHLCVVTASERVLHARAHAART